MPAKTNTTGIEEDISRATVAVIITTTQGLKHQGLGLIIEDYTMMEKMKTSGEWSKPKKKLKDTLPTETMLMQLITLNRLAKLHQASSLMPIKYNNSIRSSRKVFKKTNFQIMVWYV